MRIEYLLIRNFKSIRELEINDIEDVLILVGRNNAGKSVVLDAIRAVTGDYEVSLRDFNDNEGNISITVRISIEDEDLAVLYQKGQVSSFKHYDLWYKDFCNKLPSLKDGILEFEKQSFPEYSMLTTRDVSHQFRKILLCCRVELNMQTLKITCVYLISIRCVISALIA